MKIRRFVAQDAKTALAMMGKIATGAPRLPLAAMNQASTATLRQALADYGLV